MEVLVPASADGEEKVEPGVREPEPQHGGFTCGEVLRQGKVLLRQHLLRLQTQVTFGL